MCVCVCVCVCVYVCVYMCIYSVCIRHKKNKVITYCDYEIMSSSGNFIRGYELKILESTVEKRKLTLTSKFNENVIVIDINIKIGNAQSDL